MKAIVLANLPMFVLLVVFIWLLAFPVRRAFEKDRRNKQKPTARQPLTANEQKMFFRLQQAAPELIVLAQVSFSALITARSWEVRNTFNRKMADFVLCDRSFSVIAIVELDDSSHDAKQDRDETRDAMLMDAGYRVLRWRGIPDLDVAKEALTYATTASRQEPAKATAFQAASTP